MNSLCVVVYFSSWHVETLPSMSLVYIEMCSATVMFNKLLDSLPVIVPSGYGGEAAKEGGAFESEDQRDAFGKNL